MQSDWITSADLSLHGTCLQGGLRPRPDNGSKVREPAFSKQYIKNWAGCRSSPKISGIIIKDVEILPDRFQLAGTRVLQFAFDGHSDNPYLPHNFSSNTVTYTGTHDSAPTRQWYEELPDFQRQNLWSYLKRAPAGDTEVAPALIHLGWSSRAALAITPLQDLLNLGAESRMNIPGQASGNWRWGCRKRCTSRPLSGCRN